MKTSILRILQDGRWHGCSDFIHLGLSYRNRISELREDGWNILSEREAGTVTYKYKLHHDEIPAPVVPISQPKAPIMDRQSQLF